jgi:hypothetical protein
MARKDIIERDARRVSYSALEGDTFVVGEAVDVSGNLDRVKRMREAGAESRIFGHCIASIPLAAVSQWAQQFNLTAHDVMNDDALLDRCIADYGKFKVRGGTV